MSESLEENFKKSQPYLKLGDKEEFKGIYVGWEKIKNAFGKEAYRFTLERGDGSRLTWDSSNSRAITQMFPMKKGDALRIYRDGITKENTRYAIDKINKDDIIPF